MNEEVRVTSPTGGSKGTKPERYDLIPTEPLRLLAELYGKGANKYGDHNWRKGYSWSLSYAALQRHANQFWSGQDLDPEMQLPHVISVAFHAFALAQFMIDHPEYDDRSTSNIEIDTIYNGFGEEVASHEIIEGSSHPTPQIGERYLDSQDRLWEVEDLIFDDSHSPQILLAKLSTQQHPKTHVFLELGVEELEGRSWRKVEPEVVEKSSGPPPEIGDLYVDKNGFRWELIDTTISSEYPYIVLRFIRLNRPGSALSLTLEELQDLGWSKV